MVLVLTKLLMCAIIRIYCNAGYKPVVRLQGVGICSIFMRRKWNMKTTKKVCMLLFVVIMISLMPATTFAKGSSKKIYKDVTLKKVDRQSYDAIGYIKKFNGWKGLIKKNKFKPNKFMTRREFLVTLHNLYGRKVTAGIDDLIHADSVVTSNYCCQKMVQLSKNLGYEITWNGYKNKMRRKDVARYIKIFATFNQKLAPHRY